MKDDTERVQARRARRTRLFELCGWLALLLTVGLLAASGLARTL